MSERRDANIDDQDRAFMRRALALAAIRAGRTAPNPTVGCVIVNDGHVVGEGFHLGPGEAHAEVAALHAAGEKAAGSTAYVTLEPCNHTGRTGPCAEALIEAGVTRVVYAADDPNPAASGGAERLRAAGVDVVGGVLSSEARHLNRAWLHAVTAGRPYVIGKTAMSLDGRIATQTGESKWITGEAARQKTHELRAYADAIIVGADTVIADDPALTARHDGEVKHPLRVILDSTARTPPGALAYDRSGRGALLATTCAAPESRLAKFRDLGVDICVLDRNSNNRVDLASLLDRLHQREITCAMIEGGGRVLGSFLDANLIDELAIFIAPKIIGGGRPAFDGDGVSLLSDAARFEFEPPEECGADFYFRGFRNKERG